MNRISQTVPIQFDTGYSPYPAADWRAAFADVAQKGLTGVELAVAYPGLVDAPDVYGEAQKHELAVTTLSTGQIYGLAGLYLTSPRAEVRQKAAEIVLGHIALSTRLGYPNVTIGLLRGKLEAESPKWLLECLAEALSPLCVRAREEGVKLQLEPINRGETSFLHTTDEALSFLRGMGEPEALGILYDTYHSHLENEDMGEAVRAAAGRIFNVHFADSGRGLPGEGRIGFAPVVSALRAAGYQGAFALETQCVPTREHVLTHYAGAIKSILS